MKINIGFMGVDPIAPTVELVKLAESCGLDGVFSSEHLGFHDAIVPSAIFIQETSRLEINIVGLGAASRHPGLLAMELASLAEVSKGRLRVQVGTGADSLVNKIGGNRARPLPLVRSLVKTLRSLLNGEAVTGDLPAGVFDGFALKGFDEERNMQPYSGYPVPIDVMAIQPAMLRLAANVGEGVVLSAGCSELVLRNTVEIIEKELKEIGRKREDFRISAVSYCVVDPDADKHAGNIQRVFGNYDPVGTSKIMTGVIDGEAYIKACTEDREKAVRDFITLDVMKKVGVIAKDADGVKKSVSMYQRAGIDSVCLHLVGPMDTRAYAVECMGQMKRGL